MAEPCKEYTLKKFGTIGVLSDSTDKSQMSLAQNIRGRPVGAITGGPIYTRLCGIGNSAFVDALYFALTYTPFGGSPRALVRASDKTIAIEVVCNGEHLLLFYSLNTHKARGLFYMGNDGTFSSTPDFVGGSATLSVLAVGLDDNARWHGTAYYGAVHLGNGVDPNAVVQLSRTTLAPGKWRLAGSNARPTAPVLRQITPSSTPQVQASWTIPGTKRARFDSNTYQPCTANTGTDTFMSIAPALTHGLFAGDQVLIQPGGLSGPSANTTYFVIAAGLTANQFKISATSGGSALNLSGTGTNIMYLSVGKVSAPGHSFVNGYTFQLATDVQLPEFHNSVPLATGITYQVAGASPDQLSITTDGVHPLQVDVAGIGNNFLVGIPISGSRIGPADLTFTADPRNFPGVLGDNIYVSISYQGAGYATGLMSTMSGSGTVSDPYHYAIFTGPGFSSTADIVGFVNNDTNAIGIIVASASVVDTVDDTQSWAFHELTGGVDGDLVNGVTVGLTNKSCSVYARYWDPGVDFLGYEGINSDKSNVIVINALSNYQLEVAVAPSPTVESSRFGFIRLYFQWGEDVAAQWNLAGEVPNTVDIRTASTGDFNQITVNISTDIFTASVPTPNGLQVRILGNNTTYPAPLNGTTPYYVVNSTGLTFKLSLTVGGSPINITTTGNFTVMTYFALEAITLPGHPYSNNDVVVVSAIDDNIADPGYSPLPGPLVAGNYFIVQATSTTFGLSTLINGTPVTFGNASTPFYITQPLRKLSIGINTPIGQVMSVDQDRPLPSTLTVFAGGNVWNGGVSEFPTRLYPSKQANETELFPEGANTNAYEIMRFPASVSGQKVTALYADDSNIYVHSPGAIVFFPPATPEQKTFPRVFAGAVTESALTVWTKNRLQYLGANLELFEQIQSNITPLQSDFMALDAGAYVRSLTDLNAFAANPDRSFMFSDERGQALYYWVPGLSGSLIGFQYDQVAKGIMGPYTYPQVHAMVKLEVARSEYIFADEAGNLMVWNSAQQFDFDQALPSNSTPVVHTLGSGATTPSEAGFGQTPVTGGEYWRSSVSSLETGYLDLNKPGVRKAFLGLLVTCVKNSRALLTFTATDKAGRSVVVSYGDIYSKPIREIAKVLVNLSDTAVKIRLDLVTAEMRPFVLRDLTSQYRMLQQM